MAEAVLAADRRSALRARLLASRLYLVAARHDAAWLSRLIGAGVGVVQLRDKDATARDLTRAGAAAAEACRSSGAVFVVNDRPDVARAVGADGVHLGQDDLPPRFAREVVGDAVVIGRSTHTFAQVEAALDDYGAGLVDYIAVGPVHATPTAPGKTAVGLDLVRAAAGRIPGDVPWFAIGGIDAANVGSVAAAGARRVCVVRAITEAPDGVPAARELLAGLGAP